MIKFYFESRNSAVIIGKLFSSAEFEKACTKRDNTNKEDFDFICTRSYKHLGPHVAHGITNKACAVWMGN